MCAQHGNKFLVLELSLLHPKRYAGWCESLVGTRKCAVGLLFLLKVMMQGISTKMEFSDA